MINRKDPANGQFTFAQFCVNGHDTHITGRTKWSGCIECNNISARKYKYKNIYGITVERFNEMFIKQSGMCAICGVHQSALEKKLSVDHCHITGRVRGLLCPTCNKNLGVVENKEFCVKASLYLQEK